MKLNPLMKVAIGIGAVGAMLAVGSLLPQQPHFLKQLAPVEKAEAAATVLCAPNPVGQSTSRTIGAQYGGTGSVSSVPSGTLYILNGQGCAVIKQADVAYFQSQGFSPGPPYGASLLMTTGVATGTTSFPIGSIPPASYVQHVIVNNTTANAVTGGIAIGTTSGGNDVVTALTCGANCLTFVNDSALSKRVFSTANSQALFANAVTAWNNANVTITVVWGYF